jgi:hypothetical protein
LPTHGVTSRMRQLRTAGTAGAVGVTATRPGTNLSHRHLLQ